MTTEIQPSALNMRDGLLATKNLISHRWQQTGELLVLIHGESQIGKSTLQEIIDKGILQNITTPDQRVVIDEINFARPGLDSKWFNGLEEDAFRELYCGHFPKEWAGKLCLATMGGRANRVKELFSGDTRLVYIGVTCDSRTRWLNIYDNWLDDVKDQGYSDKWARYLLRKDFKEVGPIAENDYDPEEVTLPPSNILIDTSKKYRLSQEEALKVLS